MERGRLLKIEAACLTPLLWNARGADCKEKLRGYIPSMEETAKNTGLRSGPAGRVILGLIWLYRRTLSPALYLIGVRCRHQPTCSQYGVDAFHKHKFARAFWLTFSRVTRCHPFGSHGFDPVPDDAPDVGWKFWKLGDWRWSERSGPE